MTMQQQFETWAEMIRSDQMSHRQVIDFLEKHPVFALWYTKTRLNP